MRRSLLDKGQLAIGKIAGQCKLAMPQKAMSPAPIHGEYKTAQMTRTKERKQDLKAHAIRKRADKCISQPSLALPQKEAVYLDKNMMQFKASICNMQRNCVCMFLLIELLFSCEWRPVYVYLSYIVHIFLHLVDMTTVLPKAMVLLHFFCPCHLHIMLPQLTQASTLPIHSSSKTVEQVLPYRAFHSCEGELMPLEDVYSRTSEFSTSKKPFNLRTKKTATSRKQQKVQRVTYSSFPPTDSP